MHSHLKNLSLLFSFLFLQLANLYFAEPLVLMQPCHMKPRNLALVQLVGVTGALTCLVRRVALLKPQINLRLPVPLSQASHLMERGSPVDLNATHNALMEMIRICWISKKMGRARQSTKCTGSGACCKSAAKWKEQLHCFLAGPPSSWHD